MTFSNAMRTGLNPIDSEHAYLDSLLARLTGICHCLSASCAGCDAEIQHRCNGALGGLLTELLDYMMQHFRHEEVLMKSLGMPGDLREQHAEEHARISDRVRHCMERNPATVPIAPADLHKILSGWLEDHIMGWDMQIARFAGNPPAAQGEARQGA